MRMWFAECTEIPRIFEVSSHTIYIVKRIITQCEIIKRISGSRIKTKKNDQWFINALRSRIVKDPTKSMRRRALEQQGHHECRTILWQFIIWLKSTRHLLKTAMKLQMSAKRRKISTRLNKKILHFDDTFRPIYHHCRCYSEPPNERIIIVSKADVRRTFLSNYDSFVFGLRCNEKIQC